MLSLHLDMSFLDLKHKKNIFTKTCLLDTSKKSDIQNVFQTSLDVTLCNLTLRNLPSKTKVFPKVPSRRSHEGCRQGEGIVQGLQSQWRM